MDALSWGFVGTVIGAVVGASASIITTIINTKNTHSLQRKADVIKREQRHREFQSENLMILQEELSSNMRLTFEVHLSDLKYFKQNASSGSGDMPYLPESLNKKIRESNQKLAIVTERVANDQLRYKIQKVRQLLFEVTTASSEAESYGSINIAGAEMQNLMSDLGVHIRNLYQEQSVA